MEEAPNVIRSDQCHGELDNQSLEKEPRMLASKSLCSLASLVQLIVSVEAPFGGLPGPFKPTSEVPERPEVGPTVVIAVVIHDQVLRKGALRRCRMEASSSRNAKRR